jgi:hypothetical protein
MKAHPEIARAKAHKQAVRASDSYIRGLYKSTMSPELIEAARIRLFIKRKLLERKDEAHQ